MDNKIKTIFEIKEEDLNKEIQILNYNNKDNSNKEEIEKNCEIFIENNKIDFTYKYKFNKIGEYNITFNFNKIMTNISFLFFNCKNLKFVDFSNFNSEYNVSLRALFRNCENLQTINFIDFNTKNVSDMSFLFWNCQKLEKLNLSSFNTNNVMSMNTMFSDCFSLKELDLSNFNTKKVQNFSCMFAHCNELTNLNIKNFQIKYNTDLNDIFYGLNPKCLIICDEEKILKYQEK